MQDLITMILTSDKDDNNRVSDKEMDEFVLRLKAFGGRRFALLDTDAIKDAFKHSLTKTTASLFQVTASVMEEEEEKKTDEEMGGIPGPSSSQPMKPSSATVPLEAELITITSSMEKKAASPEPVEPRMAPVEPLMAPVEPRVAPVEQRMAPIETRTAPVEPPATPPLDSTQASQSDEALLNDLLSSKDSEEFFEPPSVTAVSMAAIPSKSRQGGPPKPERDTTREMLDGLLTSFSGDQKAKAAARNMNMLDARTV